MDRRRRTPISAALSAALLLTATVASAGWERLAEDGDTVFYVDPASVGFAGDFRRVAVVQDYAKPDAGGVRSRRVTYEIDCKGERLRSVAVAEYPEPMAQGKSAAAWERESAWHYVAPRTGSNIPSKTPYRPIVRFVCSR